MTELILFGASWCAPCKAARKALDGIAYRYVDVDLAPDEAMRYDVVGVPTLLAVREGQVISRASNGVSMALARQFAKMLDDA